MDLATARGLRGRDWPEDRHLVGSSRGFLLARRADDAI